MINYNFYQKKIFGMNLSEIIKILNLKNINFQQDISISGVNNLENAQKGEVAFIINQKYLPKIKDSKASAFLIEEKFLDIAKQYNDKSILLYSPSAHYHFSLLLDLFYQEKSPENKISEKATIASTAKIGKNCYIADNVVIEDGAIIGDNNKIFAGTYIGENVQIGNDCHIGANNVITHSIIKNNVEIMHNNSIGQDGFGFAVDKKYNFKKVLQLGLVIIENNVAIGCNNGIDKGSMENTVIGFGTRIDNLIHIAHNVQIGKNCIFTAQNGVAGSTKIGDYVTFAGQSGVAGHIKIGSYNRFAAQSGVTKNIPDNSGDFYGMPAIAKKEWQQEKLALKKIRKQYFNKKNNDK